MCALVLGLLAGLATRTNAEEPPQPQRFLAGSSKDKKVEPRGPGLILMGGGRDVDAAFRWAKPYVSGGDVVILRASGGAGYNAYLFEEIGGFDSVETFVVKTRQQAKAPALAKAIRNAELVFLAGGDQSVYLRAWRDTPVESALAKAWKRGAIIGGTSAGLAVLGGHAFAAFKGGIRSKQALADPTHERIQLSQGLLSTRLLAHVLTDTHFSERQRLGRLAVFLARLHRPKRPLFGLGVDERTALVVGPKGRAAVVGSGGVHLVRLLEPRPFDPKAPSLEGRRFEVTTLRAGHTLVFPACEHDLPSATFVIRAGKLASE